MSNRRGGLTFFKGYKLPHMLCLSKADPSLHNNGVVDVRDEPTFKYTHYHPLKIVLFGSRAGRVPRFTRIRL